MSLSLSATAAARSQPLRPNAPEHDAFIRLLHRLEPDPATLWGEVRPLLDPTDGVLVIDDSILDKPRAKHIDPVSRHGSGNRRAVDGINRVTAPWSDGDRLYPTAYRVYNETTDGKTKNDHVADMRDTARGRGFHPKAVLFDGWYASAENPKKVRGFGWAFVTRLPSNRTVRIDHGPATAVSDQRIAADGTDVWRPKVGLVRVFRVVAPNGDTTHWATNDAGMDEVTRRMFAELSWGIEEYHRGLKQSTGVERCQVRAARGQRNHIGCAIRAFVRREYHQSTTCVSWLAAKLGILREAVRKYLAGPTFTLPTAPTA